MQEVGRREWARRVGGVAVLLGALAGLAGAQVIELEEVVRGLSMPLGATHAGDGSGRLFLVEQGGRILIHQSGQVLEEPFLDISGRVSCCGERGLLGVAFHPNHKRNGRLFVNYTDARGDTVVAEFQVSEDPNRVEASSEREVLTILQPFSNHNGGHLAFGPDGFLYIASGDGGSGGDPLDNGQAVNSRLGKLLRIDIEQVPFAIPPGNPLSDIVAEGAIWAWGLRNPWRFSFDRQNGDLYIGDVGQNAIEEIDFQAGGAQGGQNYGWRLMEGRSCFDPSSGCNDGSLTLPILQYSHSQGCSVTSGFRYRGPEADTLPRFFIYGDFCSGRIWGGISDSRGNWRSRQLLRSGLAISSFGEDEAGHVYVVDYGGAIYRLRGLPLFASDFETGDTSEWSGGRGALDVTQPGLAQSANALEVPVDGTTRPRFLRADSPSAESSFLAEFRINANRVDLGGGEVTILELEGAPVVLTLQQQGRKYFVNYYVADRVSSARTPGSEVRRLTGRVRVPRKRAARVGVSFLQATTSAGFDGEVALLKKGRVRDRVSSLGNGASSVEAIKIGLPEGSSGGVSGSFLIDDVRLTP